VVGKDNCVEVKGLVGKACLQESVLVGKAYLQESVFVGKAFLAFIMNSSTQ